MQNGIVKKFEMEGYRKLDMFLLNTKQNLRIGDATFLSRVQAAPNIILLCYYLGSNNSFELFSVYHVTLLLNSC